MGPSLGMPSCPWQRAASWAGSILVCGGGWLGCDRVFHHPSVPGAATWVNFAATQFWAWLAGFKVSSVRATSGGASRANRPGCPARAWRSWQEPAASWRRNRLPASPLPRCGIDTELARRSLRAGAGAAPAARQYSSAAEDQQRLLLADDMGWAKTRGHRRFDPRGPGFQTNSGHPGHPAGQLACRRSIPRPTMAAIQPRD